MPMPNLPQPSQNDVWGATLNSVFEWINSQLTALGQPVTWANIQNKPTTFAPIAHQHVWSEVTGKPTTYPPATHTHSQVDVIGLADSLQALQNQIDAVGSGSGGGTTNPMFDVRAAPFNAVGDGVADDSAAINAAIQAAKAAGGTAYARGTFRINSPVTIDANANFGEARFDWYGTAGWAVRVGATASATISNIRVSAPVLRNRVKAAKGDGWTASTAIGFDCVNLQGSRVNFQYVEDFARGIRVVGSGVAQNSNNEFFLGTVYNCQVGVVLDSFNGGSVFSNVFHAGRFSWHAAETTANAHIQIGPTASGAGGDGNTFIGPWFQTAALEGTPNASAVSIVRGKHNSFLNGKYDRNRLRFDANATDNIFWGGFVNQDDLVIVRVPGEARNVFYGSDSHALKTHTHAWDDVSGKPTSFTPATHSHAWGDISGKPSSFTPSAHTHAWDTQADTGRRTALGLSSDWGAVGDGVADDTAALKNWLAQGGKNLTLLPGTYKVSKPLTLVTPDRYISAYGATILLEPLDANGNPSAVSPPIVFAAASTGTTLEGLKMVAKVDDMEMVRVLAPNITIRRCDFDGGGLARAGVWVIGKASGYAPETTYAGDAPTLEANTFKNFKGTTSTAYAIRVMSTLGCRILRNTITDITAVGNLYAVGDRYPAIGTFIRTLAAGDPAIGTAKLGEGVGPARGIIVEAKGGAEADNIIEGNIIKRIGGQEGDGIMCLTAEDGISSSAFPPGRMVVRNNTIEDVNRRAIKVQAAGTRVVGNLYRHPSNTRSGSRGDTGEWALANQWQGLIEVINSPDVEILDNVVDARFFYGIKVSNKASPATVSSQNVTIKRNRVTGATSDPQLDLTVPILVQDLVYGEVSDNIVYDGDVSIKVERSSLIRVSNNTLRGDRTRAVGILVDSGSARVATDYNYDYSSGVLTLVENNATPDARSTGNYRTTSRSRAGGSTGNI